MRMPDVLQKKRDGHALSAREIKDVIAAYMKGEIPDYQMSALLMAIYFRGMNKEETVALTEALVCSGEVLDFSSLGPVADKHSTGGVGDKTTLVLLPLVAAAGVVVPKMSGRGLAHTGGTIDKLSCIPGFRTDLRPEEFRRQAKEIGLAITGQTPKLAPADGKLYALRDVTATVDSIPLIASSVMSKKIASGAGSIVLDIKAGSGAFMQDLDSARRLARTMVEIGTGLGRKVTAVISDMEQPLGHAVGNHLEVMEAIEILQGRGPADVTRLCLALGAEMLLLAGMAGGRQEAEEKLERLLASGRALEKFRLFVAAQGGDPGIVEHPEKLGTPLLKAALYAWQEGYISRVDARQVGVASLLLGAGRQKKEDEIDLTAGIKLYKKTGDFVAKGELLAEMYAAKRERIAAAEKTLKAAYAFSSSPAETPALLKGLITAENL